MKSWITKNGYTIFQVLAGRSNVFLVSNGKTFMLVDTGTKRRRSALLARLEKLGVTSDSLAGLIVTHAHFDHVENAAIIRDRYHPSTFIHQTEAAYLSQGRNPTIHGTIFLTKLMTDLLESSMSDSFRYDPVDAEYVVSNKLDLSFLGFDAYLLHTPGHTVGSLSVIIDNEFAIVGDAMFGVFKGSVFPPFAGNVQQLISSWKLLLDTGCSFFLPAHGSSNSKELLQSQYEKYRQKYFS